MENPKPGADLRRRLHSSRSNLKIASKNEELDDIEQNYPRLYVKQPKSIREATKISYFFIWDAVRLPNFSSPENRDRKTFHFEIFWATKTQKSVYIFLKKILTVKLVEGRITDQRIG